MKTLKYWPLLLFACALHAETFNTRTDAKGVLQVWVPPGEFIMGSKEVPTEPTWAVRSFLSEQPVFKVVFKEGYWIDQYEVTMASFAQFAEDDGYTTEALWSAEGWKWIQGKWLGMYPLPCYDDDNANYPRGCISWYEAEAYANWRGGSLPTEAQWEYAARGPSSLIYPWGNDWSEDKANLGEHIKPVGSYEQGVSWVGAYDMSGNVMEWVADWLDWEFDRSTQTPTNPTGAPSGFHKMEKGGWYNSHPSVARSAYHHFEDPPSYADSHIGVRIVSATE